jgi:hypothetical protein
MAMAVVVPIITIMIVMIIVRIEDRMFGKTDRAVQVCNLFPDHQQAWVAPPECREAAVVAGVVVVGGRTTLSLLIKKI